MIAHPHRLPRLYVDRELEGTSLALDDREAHYLGHVLRLERGDELVVFNGRGTERQARVDELQRRGAVLTLTSTHAPLPESVLELTLLQSLPKSDAMDLIVQKATELGVHTVIPVYTEHSVVKLDAERSERRVDHWRKIAQGACEQCGRHRPPKIEPPAALATALDALPSNAVRLALDPAARFPLAELAPLQSKLIVAVGPEGGFGSMDWLRLDRTEFARVSLGQRVLRAETAAIAACVVAQACWGDLR